MRARLNAAVLDLLLVGLLVRGLIAAAGAAAFSGDAVLLLVAVEFMYFFVLEAWTGQTIGKRALGVRVVAIDGSRLTWRMCALRNLLRFIDALPLLYASGLLSLMRTGRARRQRIGDVVAGTTVGLGPRGTRLRTPRWLLPTSALLATLLSVAAILAGLQASARQRVVIARAAVGFTGDSSQAPALGVWAASGTITSMQGYGNDAVGQQMFRQWKIARVCSAGVCASWLTRQMGGEMPLTAPLIPAGNGWHATFPDRTYGCRQLDGQTITWRQHSTWVLRFTNHGTSAVAHELNVSYAPACGWGTDTVTWSADLSRMPWQGNPNPGP